MCTTCGCGGDEVVVTDPDHRHDHDHHQHDGHVHVHDDRSARTLVLEQAVLAKNDVRAEVVIMSVTEGQDKPLKYPQMFRAAELMVLNKVDLLPYVQFDPEQCITYARQVNPKLEVVSVSATRGDGLGAWYDWLRAQR